MWYSYDGRPLSEEEATARDRLVQSILDLLPEGTVARRVATTDAAAAVDGMRRLCGALMPGDVSEPVDIRWAARRYAAIADAHRWCASIAESRTLARKVGAQSSPIATT